MRKVLNTRAEKIKLLNDLKTGKTTIRDSFPQKVKLWIINNGIATCHETNEILTGNDLIERQKNNNEFFIKTFTSTISIATNEDEVIW